MIAANIDTSQFREETEEEKKERWGHPTYDIKQLLTEQGLKDKIEKLEEKKIDAQIFWELNEKDLENELGVSVFGQRKLLMERMQDLKEEHTKAMEKKDK